MAETSTAHAYDLLVEIGTEELPPTALPRMSRAFAGALEKALGDKQLAHGQIHAYATPRRLAVVIEAVADRQPDADMERRGPALKAAFDANGAPTKAAEGFARSCGVPVQELERLETDAGAWLVHRHRQTGAHARSLLADIVRESADQIPVPKRMRWADLDVEFSRPVQWVTLLYGSEPIEADLLGVTSGATTYGHRFHAPGAIRLDTPAAYAERLRNDGYVEPDFAKRRENIRAQIEAAASGTGGRAVIDEELLDEVTALVEWPSAVIGDFDERYLALPDAVLIATMKSNQRYFHLVQDTASGERLLPRFVTISNIESTHPESVSDGNERVIRPRLADAEFFHAQDLKTPLADRRRSLESVVFQTKLGSLWDKTERVAALTAYIAEALGLDAATVDAARRAAEIAKCDLVTDMVGEFPELQGIMGEDYALRAGEPPAVATAIREAYLPRFAGDEIAASMPGRVLSIAERLDTLVGIFGIGQIPKGDRDPFALRRAALGMLRVLIEGELDLDVTTLVERAIAAYSDRIEANALGDTVLDFMFDRLRAYFVDQGIGPDVYAAVLARRPTRPLDFARRIRAVTDFCSLPEARSLAAANKRIQNILKQVEGATAGAIDASLLSEDAERRLASGLDGLRNDVTGRIARADYAGALSTLASLQGNVDAFFDTVRVMDDDESVKRNRISLLAELSGLFLATADVSLLQLEQPAS